MGISGIQQAAIAMLKSMAENLPPDIKENIVQVGQIVADFQTRLTRIEAKLDTLLTRSQEQNSDDRPDLGPARINGPVCEHLATGEDQRT